jgi:predicted RNase H-like HicB family nuclease
MDLRNKFHGGSRMPQYQYTAVFEPAEEGGYVVTVPALPGLVTEGDTLEEARAMVKDAIRGYLESLVKNGEEIPLEPNPATVERVEVKI